MSMRMKAFGLYAGQLAYSISRHFDTAALITLGFLAAYVSMTFLPIPRTLPLAHFLGIVLGTFVTAVSISIKECIKGQSQEQESPAGP